jgi:hypothetical protein
VLVAGPLVHSPCPRSTGSQARHFLLLVQKQKKKEKKRKEKKSSHKKSMIIRGGTI